ncbi:uncharacterized protein LOC132048701 [Lycium ferocissimum]|uniref:uncharacterized protein LOC132048701 n=1 Tax=Lycium ferocissimum TaxID=112874 RepID=UPI0028167E4D|nr:uncharacterized protein LOC132048701 [Lycium ferocissimum]
MWLTLHGRLLTSDRLIKWGLDVEPLCILCQQCHEDRSHLFVGCPFANQLWSRLFSWIQRQFSPAQTWGNHLTWVLQCGKGKSHRARIFRMVYAEGIHSIWIERNQRLFEKRSRDVASIAREIAYICNVRAGPGLSATIQSYQF